MPEPVHQPGTAAAASASSRSATQMHAQSQPAAFSAGSVLSLPRIAIDLPRRLGDLLQSGDLEMKAAHPDGPTSSTTSGAGSIRSPHQWTLHVEESLEDDQASFTADLLSPCTLGVAIPADSGESAFLASSCAPTNATSGVGQVLPAIAASSDVKRIDGETMARLLQGAYKGQGEHQVEQFVVIDCRYDYEYAGGHIAGAININDRAVLSKFFRTHSSASSSHRLAIIFHCEFSQNRAPKSYKFFRSLDRLRNQANYPQLSFPELCVLDGGYKKFVRDYPQHCARTPLTDLGNVQPTAAAGPGLYISMWDEEYTAECKTRTAAHRKSWNTNKLLASDLINTPCVSAKKAPRHNAAAAEDMLCSSSKKSPASRGLKRSAADASPDHLLAGGGAAASFTPSGRSNSNPEDGSGGEGRRFRGRTNLFAPFRSGGLFASPMRNDGAEGGSQADHGRTRGSGSAMMMSGLSPLPSFELLSTPAPHTPAVDSDVLMAIQPVPFPMMCSPDKQ